MHDGSLETLRDVVVHYNNGGVTNEGDPGQRLPAAAASGRSTSTDEQIDDLVAFMEALTSPEFEPIGRRGRRRVEEATMTTKPISTVATSSRAPARSPR